MRNKTNLANRILSGLLAVMMIAGIFGTWPIAIFAEDQAKENVADVWDGSIANGFGGGSGSSDDPYQIYTGAQLAYLASGVNGGNSYSGKYLKLMNDIDLNGIEWTPIGNQSRKFTGFFDGGYHEISNMAIHKDEYPTIGLFGGVEGNIANLAVVGFDISGAFTTQSYYSIGGLVGWSSGNINNCYATGSIDAYVTTEGTFSRVGLLAGQILGQTQNCFSFGTVKVNGNQTETYIGGFVGFINSGNVYNSYTFAEINASGNRVYVGGFAGSNGHDNYSTGTISKSFSVALIESGFQYGNFVGISKGSESGCYYCTESATGTQNNTRGVAQTFDAFLSQDWIISTLGWDFETVWTTDAENFLLPVLLGFGPFDINIPEQPEDCNHNYVETERVDATCTTSGYVRYTCSNCGDYYEEGISSPGHKYENGVCVVCGQLATYTSVASKGYRSNQEALDAGEVLYLHIGNISNDLFGADFKALGLIDQNGNPMPDYLAYNDPTEYNTYEGWETGNTDWMLTAPLIWKLIGPGGDYAQYCEPGGGYEWVVINGENGCKHNYIVTESAEPTCTAEGYIRYTCTGCGDFYEEKLAALGHTTNDGTCDRCGEYFEAPKADLWDGTVAGSFGGGSGTEADPYLIFTGAELAYLAASVNGGNSYSGKYFLLMNDIDLGGIEWTPIGTGVDYDSSSYSFGGNFDGCGMTISNLYETRSRQFAGLFGVIYGATISNLGIDNAYIYDVYNGDYCLVGGLAGSTANSKISNCYVVNSVLYGKYSSGLCAVGGMFGELYSSQETVVSNCFTNCEVTSSGSGNSAAGGLIGIVDWDSGSYTYKINSCYTAGTVSSNTSTGGFIGLTWSDVIYINNSFAGAVVSSGSSKGAFIGRNNTATLKMSGCYYLTGQSNSVGSATAAAKENLQSQEWLTSTLGWDFENVWMFDYNNDYAYPVLQGFGNVGGNAHAHNYVESERVEATCGTEGYIRYTCTECNRSYQETIPAFEHNYYEFERVEPTCQYEGYIRYSCMLCGDYYDEPLHILAHDYYETERVEPTCQNEGYIRYTCMMCGDYYDETLYTFDHQYNETERVEPTCQVEGYIRYTCTMCGDYYDDVLPTIRHNVGEDNYCTMCGEYIEAPKADLWDGTVAGSFGGGSGTAEDPYLIYTGAELAYLAESVNNGNRYSGQYFWLMNNIDLCGIEWTPIGKGQLGSDHTSSIAFGGYFNGNNFIISNLFIANNYTSFAGLFGVTISASVRNLAIVGADITNSVGSGYRSKAGALIGHATNTTVERCSVTDSSITAIATTKPSSAGGLIGIIYGVCTVSNCYVNAEVLSNGHVGGIVGGNYGETSTIQNCYSAGRVIFDGVENTGSSKAIAGIIGYNQESSLAINSCFTCVSIEIRKSVGDSSQISAHTARVYNCYYSISDYVDHNTGTYISSDNFTSYEWIASTLGWDFESVWAFDNNNEYAYPVLQGFNGVDGGDIHVHNYVEAERVEPTCGVDGYIRYTCTECDRFYDETLPAFEHNYCETERVEPTCQVEGYIRYTCTMCGDYYDETLYTLAHDYYETERVEPTCQNEGYIRYTCMMCGDYYDETLYTLNHQYSESERVEPTCQYEGYIRYTCMMCGEYYDDVLPTIRHNVGEDNYCTMCGEYIEYVPTDILVVQNHEPWQEGSNQRLMQTLLAEGKINSYKIISAYDFENEDLNKYSIIYLVMNNDALSSSQVNSMYNSILDFLNAGGTVIYGLCWQSNQGSVYLPAGAAVNKSNSDYSTIVDYNHPIMSGELTDGIRFPDRAVGNSLNHTTVYNLPENANIILKDDNGGTILAEYTYGNGNVILSCLTWECFYKTNYNNVIFSDIAYDDLILYAAALSGSGIGGDHCKHSFIETEIVEPTCTTEGYTCYACELCGYTYKGNYVPQYGHTVGEWIIDYEPTCTTSGRKHSECAVCGQQLENIYISSLGHNYVTVVTREVTCTTPGILTHTCERCGSSYSTYVYSEHAYSITEQVQPTCYTDGYTVYTCSKCGDFYTEVIPGGHDYKSTITKVATSEEDGEITYTCEACGDSYTEVIPAREAANVLLVQDRYPWGENNNAALLNQMLADGYITGWDLTTTSNFANVDLGAYNVILIANDQSSATYNQLNYLSDTLVQFATAGGVVIYGACDSGWAGGYINYTLPEGVVKKNFYSRYNYIVDGDHLIVSGILTDGKSLTDNLLNGNYCSHSAFDANTLPEGANVILQDAHGDATLVEYAVGDGHIILSGLTWEFYYNRNCYDGRTNTSYTKNVYDDLVMYALYLSDPCEHIYDEGVVVEPTCTEDGYVLHTCQNCGATMKDNVVEALGHTEGEWTVTTEPTQYTEGLKELCCSVCGEVLKSEVLPPLGGAAARVESDFDYVVIGDTIVFTLVIENCDLIKSLSVVPMFDTNVFDIVSAEWLLQDAMIQDIEEGTYKSVSVWGDYVDVNCAVYRIVLKAKQFTDDTSVSFSLKVEDKEGVVTVVAKSVSVTECPHANTSVENIDGTYHARVCDLCGYAVMEEHIYDNDYDLECNECGNTRECPHPEIYVSILDGTYHVYTCNLCGHTEHAEHMYDSEYDLVCDECGYQRECYHPETYVVVVDGSYHAHVCNVCGYEEAEVHTYDDGYDLVCDTCGYERECPHTDTYVEMRDDTCHAHICKNCGFEKIEEHIYGDEFNVYCKECGYMNALKGDVDNDGDVDSDDAVYLVYNVFFGSEDYPVAQSLDFDGDGQETTDDAIYLLYFIYFGEASYPLH